jgi:hypothetical protein
MKKTQETTLISAEEKKIFQGDSNNWKIKMGYLLLFFRKLENLILFFRKICSYFSGKAI